MKTETHIINFFVVYTTNRKKLEKYIKTNRIRNKYVIDIKKLIEEEELQKDDVKLIKILVFNRLQQAIEKGRDIYYLPDFDSEFSISKLLNLKKLLVNNNFNILIFYSDFVGKENIIEEALDNLSQFSNSQILKDY